VVVSGWGSAAREVAGVGLKSDGHRGERSWKIEMTGGSHVY
jgi:hypothetical protein